MLELCTTIMTSQYKYTAAKTLERRIRKSAGHVNTALSSGGAEGGLEGPPNVLVRISRPVRPLPQKPFTVWSCRWQLQRCHLAKHQVSSNCTLYSVHIYNTSYNIFFLCELTQLHAIVQEGYLYIWDPQLRSHFGQVKIFRKCPKSLGQPGFGPNFSVDIEAGTPENFRSPY